MKNNTPPTAESAAPLSLKLTLIGSCILIAVILVFTVRSIIGIFRSNSVPSTALQTNTETVAINPKPPAETPISSASGNFGAQIPPNLSPMKIQPLSVPNNSQPAAFAGPNETVEQRKQARIASLQALQRHLELNTPYEIRKQREKQRKALIEAAKQELLKQAGTSGVPQEVLQKLDNSNPIPF